MTKIVATFSNGHTDTYNGDRPVRAGWMVVTPEGKVLSGHSLNRVNAMKTAEGNAKLMVGYDDLPYITRSNCKYPWAYIEAKKAGFKSPKAVMEAMAAKRAAYVAQCRFEVIDL